MSSGKIFLVTRHSSQISIWHALKQGYILFLINKFIYFWLRWVFVAVLGLSLVAASGAYSSLWCAGLSLRWLLLLQSTGYKWAGFSSCGSRALEHRLSSCGAWASLLHGMWDLPGPGLEPMSPALAGGFLSTVPPGKPQSEDTYLTCKTLPAYCQSITQFKISFQSDKIALRTCKS